MDRRTELHEKLCELLGSRYVYYQPPESIKMNFPCIVYERNDIDVGHADNHGYMLFHRYKVTYIDKNPDNDVIEKLAHFKGSRFDRHYKASNLNHDVFTIYY